MGAFTIGVDTRPFLFEGEKRLQAAEKALAEFCNHADSLITIPCDRLSQIAPGTSSHTDMFTMADEVLYHAVKGISDVLTKYGLIGVDIADMRTVMGGGCFLMG